MRRALTRLLQVGILVACAAYLMADLDVWRLAASFARVPVWLLFAGPGLVLVILAGSGYRLSSLAPGLSFSTAARAEALATCCNNLLPAKLGELAKVAYLARRLPGGLCAAIDGVFWSRFLDINALLVLGLAAGSTLDARPTLALGAVIGAGWLGLVALRVRPAIGAGVLRLLPRNRFADALRRVAETVPGRLAPRFVLHQSGCTALIWSLNLALHWLAMRTMLTPAPSWEQAFAVTVAGILGLVAPSLPGAVGVYEAAMVLALGAYGYDKSEALAVAVFLHLTMVLPISATGLWVLAQEGIGLKGLLASGRASEPGPDCKRQ